jgi:hypothetical protein
MPRRRRGNTVDLGEEVYNYSVFKSLSARRPSCPPVAKPLEILFVDEDGFHRKVVATRQPLGATFTRGSEGEMIKTRRVTRYSHADELGIKEGWLVRKVDGEDVASKDFEDVQAILKKRMAHLPAS